MRDVDFSAATFRDVEFRGFDLEEVALPADPDVFLVRRYRCVAERGLGELENDDSLAADMLRAELSNSLRGPASSTGAHVYSRRDYLASGGEELATLAEDLFRRLAAACLAAERPRGSRLGRLLGNRGSSLRSRG